MRDLELLSAYDYALPAELIAQYPAEPRDSSRLLVVDRATRTMTHRRFSDLPDYLDSKDILIANNSRVIRARLLGNRYFIGPDGLPGEGGKIEFLMLDKVDERTWEGALHASAKHKPGLRFRVPTPDGKGIIGELVRGASDSPHGLVTVRFDRDPVEAGAGVMPLPPYIERQAENQDEGTYQTVYSKVEGSAAAPTAGLHFTDRVLGRLRDKGVAWDEVTLHVGLGTFRPVKAESVREHVMHEERYWIDPAVAARVNASRSDGKRIVAVGTTTVRTLEGAWREGSGVQAGAGKTSIFIRPGGREFHIVDRLITNFHLPKSTLLMLVAAFAGYELTMAAYEEAIRERYRFFSYGDAMLIL